MQGQLNKLDGTGYAFVTKPHVRPPVAVIPINSDIPEAAEGGSTYLHRPTRLGRQMRYKCLRSVKVSILNASILFLRLVIYPMVTSFVSVEAIFTFVAVEPLRLCH
ncbi:MAG: hypothetical protein NVS9B9_26860 [Ktedonobacteraceae bacterium]